MTFRAVIIRAKGKVINTIPLGDDETAAVEEIDKTGYFRDDGEEFCLECRQDISEHEWDGTRGKCPPESA